MDGVHPRPVDIDRPVFKFTFGHPLAARSFRLHLLRLRRTGWRSIRCILVPPIGDIQRPLGRRDLHRRVGQRKLHWNQQADCQQRPHKADRPRRIPLFEHAAQHKQHKRRRGYRQPDLYQMIGQIAPRKSQHILPLPSYRPCASRKARRSSMSCSVSAPASDRLATRFLTEPPHSRLIKLVLSRCR